MRKEPYIRNKKKVNQSNYVYQKTKSEDYLEIKSKKNKFSFNRKEETWKEGDSISWNNKGQRRKYLKRKTEKEKEEISNNDGSDEFNDNLKNNNNKSKLEIESLKNIEKENNSLINDLNKAEEKYSEDIKTIKKNEKVLVDEINKKKEENERLKKEIETFKNKEKEKYSIIDDLKEKEKKYCETIALLEKKEKDFAGEINKKSEENEKLKIEIEKLKNKEKEKESKINDLIKKEEKYCEEINIFRKHEKDFVCEINKINKENEDFKKTLKKEYEKNVDEKEKEIQLLKENIKKYELQFQKLKEENIMKNDRLTELQILINEKNHEVKGYKESLENEKNKNDFFSNNIKKKELEIEQLKNRLRVINEISTDKGSTAITNNNEELINKQIKEKEKIVENKKDNENNIYKYGKIGLKNEELNCYMNSVLQILKNIKSFSFKILEIEKKDDIFINFKNLLGDLLYSKEKYISPFEFKRSFSFTFKRFYGTKENDSTYFLIYLLQYFHKLFNEPNKNKNNNKTEIDTFKILRLNDSEMIELRNFLSRYESKNNSFIHDLFFGYQMNKLFCIGCNYSQVSFQSYNILDIPLMDEKKKLNSLEECLNCYLITKDQKGVEGFSCDKCKKKLMSHVTNLIMLPKILIINLKRVGESRVYYHEIDIPFTFKTKQIDKLNKIDKTYELIGFIKHYGNEKNGHNVAFTKNIFDQKWYLFDDKIVEEESNFPSTKKAFLLFYQSTEIKEK